MERRRVQGDGDLLGALVEAVRVPPDVEQSAHGRRLGDHDAGVDVRRRAHRAHRIRVGVVPEHDPLVLDAVLEARDRDVGRRARIECLARADRVLRLHGEAHDVVGRERELRGMVDDGDRQGRVVDRGPDAEAAVADGFVVRAARDEHDVVAVLEEARADDTADCARAVDHEPHREVSPGGGRGRTRAPGRARRWVGWPGSSTRCSVSTECAVFGMPCGLPGDESISTPMKLSPSSSRVPSPARVGHGPVLGEAQAEHAQVVVLDAGLHAREVGVGEAERALARLAERRTAATAG